MRGRRGSPEIPCHMKGCYRESIQPKSFKLHLLNQLEETMADRSQFREGDPRHHTARLKQMLTEVIDHAREDVSKVMDPRAQALFESTRKCSSGLERHMKITRK